MANINRRKLLRKIFGNLFLGFFVTSPFSIPRYASANEIKNPQVDQIVVWKSKRRLTLFSQKKPLKIYRIRLGFDPIGPKRKEGDGRTPEGNYLITHKNPNSAFHKSLGISYPNNNDKLLAKINGVSPGKDIFIHGGPKNFLKHLLFDWTEGCIAVTDNEIDEIYDMVTINTPVYIAS